MHLNVGHSLAAGCLAIACAAMLLELNRSSLRAQGTAEPDIRFLDITKESGIDFRHAASPTKEKYLPETMGGGVALFDFDGDGRLDVFFVNGAELKSHMRAGSPEKTSPRFWNRMYRNLGGWKFEDVTERQSLAGEGYTNGVAVGDFDGDGRSDLYVTGVGRNYLYRNTPEGFREVAVAAGVAASGWSMGAAFLDFDGDGHLDLFVARYLNWDFAKSRWCGEGEGTPRSYCHPRFFGAVSHLLFRNRGDGTFTNVSAETGIDLHPGKGLGVKVEDIDDDGWPDILVANDSVPQQLFLNRGGKRFEEVAVRRGLAYDEDGNTYAGMGIDAADVNGDGRPDVFVNALARQGYWLYRQGDKGAFAAVSSASGLAAMTEMRSGWGARLADFDNDGWPDLLVAQGHVMDTIEWSDPAVRYREPPLLAKNLFGRFFDVGHAAGEAFHRAEAGRGLAVGDLDGDGLPDAVISNNDAPPTVLRNVSPRRNRWLAVKLDGRAFGARVYLMTSSGRKLRAYVNPSGSYVSASAATAHFGLGEDSPKSLEVIWPRGKRSLVEDLTAGDMVVIKE